MPSRRHALAALGSAATLSFSGCLDVQYAPSAYCQLKSVLVEWSHGGQRYRDDVGRSMGHPAIEEQEGSVRTYVAEELPGLASTPRDLAVDEDVRATLDREFTSVEYVLGVCGDALDGCRNTRVASREGFNSVQVGDEAAVTLSDDTFRIRGVDPAAEDAVADWETAIRHYDFSRSHADHGEPLGEL